MLYMMSARLAFARLRRAHKQQPQLTDSVVNTAKVLSLGYGVLKRRFSSADEHNEAMSVYQEPRDLDKHKSSVYYINPLSRKEESVSPHQRALSNWILNVTKDGYYYFYDIRSGQNYRETLPED